MRPRRQGRFARRGRLYEHALDSAAVRLRDIPGQPVGAQQVPRHLDDDVVGVDVGIVVVALQALQARWAGGQNLDVSREAVGAQLRRALPTSRSLRKRTWVATSGREIANVPLSPQQRSLFSIFIGPRS
jgi:hypothetical protein